MILNRQPVNMNEVKKILEGIADNDKKEQMQAYLKKFSKTKAESAEKMKKELEELGMLKLKTEHIVKIIDLKPEDNSDLNKIFTEISLTEDEGNKILEIVKNNK